jgi:uncharacterized protein DUF6812
MSIEFDEKGKYFTDIISKIAVSAIIQTATHRIEGAIYVRPGSRIKDELDHTEPFMAVTNAKVYDANGNLIHECGFMTVSRSQIVWVIPQDEHDNTKGGEA